MKLLFLCWNFDIIFQLFTLITLVNYTNGKYPKDCDIVSNTNCFELQPVMNAYDAKSYCTKRTGEFEVPNETDKGVLSEASHFTDIPNVWVSVIENHQRYRPSIFTCRIFTPVLMDVSTLTCERLLPSICKFSFKECKLSELKESARNAHFKNCRNESSQPMDEVTVECKEGYILQNGSKTVKCHFDGEWSHLPQCIEGCPPPKIFKNSFLTHPKDIYTIGEKAIVMCNNTFLSFKDFPVTHIFTTCLKRGIWSESLSDCLPVENLFYHYDFVKNKHFELRVPLEDTMKLNICKFDDNVEKVFNDSRSIIWFKDQVELTNLDQRETLTIDNDFSLKFLNFSIDDEGSYTCLIKDNVLSSVIDFCTYQIGHVKQCSDKIVKQLFFITLQEGTNQLVTCGSDSYIYKAHWFKDGKRLWGDSRHILLVDGSLFIQNVSVEDTGNYQCKYVSVDFNCSRKSEIFVNLKRKVVCGRLDDNFNTTSVRPWLATLWYEGEVIPFCYASLIDSYWLVTSATCLSGTQRKRKPGFTVKLGATSDSFEKAVVYEVSKVKLHPRYSKRLSSYDVALIKLENPVIYTNDIYPICFLGSNLEGLDSCGELKAGITVGWGPLGSYEETSDLILTSETLTMAENTECKDLIRIYLPEYMFCAKGKLDTNHFAGDSGSAFEIQWKNHWYLWGVLSWGDRAYAAGNFDYFSKMIKFENWIQSNIKSVDNLLPH